MVDHPSFHHRLAFYEQLLANQIPGITIPITADARCHCFRVINLFYDGWKECIDSNLITDLITELGDPYAILAKLLVLQQLLTEINAPLSLTFELFSQVSPPSLHMAMFPSPGPFPSSQQVWGNTKCRIEFTGSIVIPSAFLRFYLSSNSKYQGVWTSFWIHPSERTDNKVTVKVADAKLRILKLRLQWRKKSWYLRFRSHKYRLQRMTGELPSLPAIDMSSPPKLPSKIEEQMVLSIHPYFAPWFQHYKIVPMPKIARILLQKEITFPLSNDIDVLN